MWYTLPWAFDEFFHEYIPTKWITLTQIFITPSHNTTTMNQSSLRELDAVGQTVPSHISFLPHVSLSDSIEILHLSFYNKNIYINLPALRNVTLVNSINCLNCSSSFPTTIRSIRILLFYTYPNYMLPNWPILFHSLSKWPQLSLLCIFMYDSPKILDEKSCQIIAKATLLFRDFRFYIRRKFRSFGDDNIEDVFEDHAKFIKQLYHQTLLLPFDKQSYYSIEDDAWGLTIWL